MLEERTGGRLKFEDFWGGSLLKGPETAKGIGTGIADLGLVGAGYNPGMFPYIMVGQVPFQSAHPYAHHKAQEVIFNAFKEVQANWERANLYWIFADVSIPGYLNVDRPIRTVEDLKDVKIRGYGYVNNAMERLGASPAAIAYGETYSALQTGVVGGAIGSAGDSYAMKWYEPTTYQVDFDIGIYIVAPWCWNLDSWNALPDDIKKIIEDSKIDRVEKAVVVGDELAQEWLATCVAKGNDVYRFPDEEITKARDLVKDWFVETWVNEVPEEAAFRQSLVNVFLAAVKKYEGDRPYTSPFMKYK